MFPTARLIFATVVATATMALAQNATCSRFYTVNLGDTCNAISADQDVSTYQLAFVNQGTIDAACDNLAEGEPLCLGIVGQDCGSVHVVYSGDSCANIVSTAGVSLSTLLANNPNVNADCTNIYPGEVLCTSNTIFNYTTVYNYTSTA
ncbi:carbohydrate-binding module family 50 protein [Neolentinus lepideus HHB14362 ss-1]|uniref:Carbohydrate-binding module family 50 protein n=1 Tax=Neolentinus lepideus HHB14362 ss-1 TaxID=1314782 RepID=A0A165SPV8_9AGAM|nr:carbohydrate-binding module family 50 protein [Neolentinus lepideus HHB14362 ss-1]